jgi:phosphoglycolate phosphatase
MAKTLQYSAILFDLDGTLTNSRIGNIRCFKYALAKMGLKAPPVAVLTACIGPPLRTSFAKLLDTRDPTVIETGLAHFRDRYTTTGLFESEPYPGMADMLATLRHAGLSLFVVTSTPTYFAWKILEHFSLAAYFEEIYGPKLDGTYDDKGDLIKFVLGQRGLDPASTLMVGDRRFDMEAAEKNGIAGLGVTYGFGSAAELLAAGAAALCDSDAAVAAWILAAEVYARAGARQDA